jgi:hypothetical protein
VQYSISIDVEYNGAAQYQYRCRSIMGQYSIRIDVEYNGAVQYQYRCRV